MKKVSIVVPVRDRTDLLQRCLSALATQAFPLDQCEILVCDDGSEQDPQPAVAGSGTSGADIRVLRTRARRGPAAARNVGIRAARAPVVVCVDSDVVCGPDFLKHVVEALDAHPGWVAAEAAVLPSPETVPLLCDAPRNDRGRAYLSSACAYRVDALKKAGGFDEDFPLPACEDAELAHRLLALGEFGYVAAAQALHPVRPVTARTHWLWRRHWRYEMYLAVRCGFLGFPGRPAGSLPRLRLAAAALATLPLGRFIGALAHERAESRDRLAACLYALFDVVCGVCALPVILFGPVPERRNWLAQEAPANGVSGTVEPAACGAALP